MDSAENRNSIFHTFGFYDEDRKLLVRGMICTYLLGLFAHGFCLLYTSDAADDLTRVVLAGRRLVNK